MNILIFPTDDRSGQVALIYHYQKMGHKVFVPKHGTFGLNWKRIATWPSLLCKSSQSKFVRNIDIHGFVRTEENIFGEDSFLLDFSQPLYDDDVCCDLIDETFSDKIDAFHTLRGGESYLQLYFDIVKKYWPNAKWISSTFNQHTSTPGNFAPTNVVKFIPAPYEDHHPNVNNVCVMSSDFESRLLNAKCFLERRGFASFNHNYEQRQPDDFKLFSEMNMRLKSTYGWEVQNFGGNIRTQGADTRFSEKNGITGNFTTVTPRKALMMTKTILASIHFKAEDWGGGVFYYSLNSETPIVTTQRYVNTSNSSKFLIHEQNAIIIPSSPVEAFQEVWRLHVDASHAKKLSKNMLEMKKAIFSEDYWLNWERFLENVL